MQLHLAKTTPIDRENHARQLSGKVGGCTTKRCARASLRRPPFNSIVCRNSLKTRIVKPDSWQTTHAWALLQFECAKETLQNVKGFLTLRTVQNPRSCQGKMEMVCKERAGLNYGSNCQGSANLLRNCQNIGSGLP